MWQDIRKHRKIKCHCFKTTESDSWNGFKDTSVHWMIAPHSGTFWTTTFLKLPPTQVWTTSSSINCSKTTKNYKVDTRQRQEWMWTRTSGGGTTSSSCLNSASHFNITILHGTFVVIMWKNYHHNTVHEESRDLYITSLHIFHYHLFWSIRKTSSQTYGKNMVNQSEIQINNLWQPSSRR